MADASGSRATAIDHDTASPIPPAGRILALDWGARRIGIAISDASQLIATPLAVLTRRTGKRLPLGPFLSLVEREHPVGLVVGLATDDEGREGESAAAAREMARLFGARSTLPVAWWDESFSTVTAAERLADARPRRKPAIDLIDAAAAAVLLQSWLDHRRRAGA